MGYRKKRETEYKMLFSIFGNKGKAKAEEVTGEQSSRRFVTQDRREVSTCA